VRTPVSEISIIGRNTQGVRLIRVQSGQRLVGLARIESIEDEDE
jgi:DNA gyrase subunit A